MARMFIEIGGTKYEKKFKSDKSPYYVNLVGKVIEGAEARRLDESLARYASRARSRSAVELRESARPKYHKRFRPNGDPFYIDDRGVVVDEATAKTNLVENLAESATRQRIEQEAAARRREAQARKRAPSTLSEAERTAKRVRQLMSAGMNEAEAKIAAVGRYVDSLPCE